MKRDPFDFLPIVRAAFPSPADEYLEPDLDFNSYFKKNPSATIPVRVKGDSMVNSFIPHNSIVIVDRSIKPANNSVVVVTLNGENIIKHLVHTADGVWLLPANEKYRSIKLTDEMDYSIWGTAKHVIIDL